MHQKKIIMQSWRLTFTALGVEYVHMLSWKILPFEQELYIPIINTFPLGIKSAMWQNLEIKLPNALWLKPFVFFVFYVLWCKPLESLSPAVYKNK